MLSMTPMLMQMAMCGYASHAQTAHTVISQAVSVLVIDAQAIGVVLSKNMFVIEVFRGIYIEYYAFMVYNKSAHRRLGCILM